MPGSFESDKSSSPSLISSLRNFRFTSKTKRYQPDTQSTSTVGQTSNNTDSLAATPDSTTSRGTSDSSLSSPGNNNRSGSAKVTSSSSKPQTFSPLSYRNYEATASSQFLLPCILNKFTKAFKKTSPKSIQLEVSLTEEELQKVKEFILQDPSVSEKWNSNVTENSNYELPREKVLKVSRAYLTELQKFVKNVYHNNFLNKDGPVPEQASDVQRSPRTYSRGVKKEPNTSTFPVVTPEETLAISEQPDLNQLKAPQTKGIMDEYEVFCSKEQNLRRLLDAFPGADIMEAQDILVRCDWNYSKAVTVAQTQPLRCTKKRSLSLSSSSTAESISSQPNQGPMKPVSSAEGATAMAEEIVLDSSDEDTIQPKTVNSARNCEKTKSGPPAPKRIRQRISSSETDDESSLTPPPVSVKQTNATQKPANSQSQSSLLNSNNKEKTFSVSQSVTIKAVPSSSANNSEQLVKTAPNNIPNLPKGLVILQVNDSSSANAKTLETPANNRVESGTRQKAEVINIPSSSMNHDRSAQLVRITSLKNGVTVKPTDGNSFMASSKSLSVTPSNKGVSITPVSKGVSITPVPSAPKASASSAGPSKQGNSEANPKNSAKAKRKKDAYEEEDDEDYGNDILFDSEDSDFEEENLTAAHSAVLKFFQESASEELMCVPGCSKKKVESIMKLRPFSNWADLVEKLGSDKYLSTDLLNGAKRVLDMRNAINKLMTKCQQISYDMEDLVENLKENRESCSGYVNKQPDLLNDRMHLTAYQMLGLNWLLLMHNQEVNGILADEMGLGKTVQAIAFLAYLKELSISGPHLIVVPSSVLDNWKQEFRAWWPDISMICYHGSQDSRREMRIQILNDEVDEFDVMITTYSMVTSSAEDRGFFKRLEFHYVVFDEAHMLKNMASQRYQHLMKVKAPRRLLLTGTPLQNNLVELMSLLIFAMPQMFSGKTEHVKQMFSTVSKTEGNKNTYEKDRIDHAKRIMKPFVLRRLKKDVLQDLPDKHDDTKFCPMTEDQAKKYEELVAKFSEEMSKDQGKDGSSNRGQGMMMQLRRAANHPLLLKRFYNDNKLSKMSKAILKEPTHCEADPKLVFEDMSVMSDFELHNLCKAYKSLKPYVLTEENILNSGKFKVMDSLLPGLIEKDHRILLFSQFTMVLDIIEEYMNIKKYKFLRLDGQVPVPERQQLIDEFNSDPSIFVFLLSTRAGGLGINLTAADTVILHDIDFNPYNDKQAEDRCHRVGQLKEVSVLRLISESTIEEGILQRAIEKLKLERDIHEENDDEENDTASVAKLLRDALGLKSIKS